MNTKKHCAQDDVLAAVKVRLEEWAEWYSRGQMYGLGYPSHSIEYQVLKGGGGTQQYGCRLLSANEEAEEMEAWVCEMSKQNPSMARALRCYYFDVRSLRKAAQHLEIAPTQFKLYLEMAHQWLAGRWSVCYGKR
jgi:hypothetical protein